MTRLSRNRHRRSAAGQHPSRLTAIELCEQRQLLSATNDAAIAAAMLPLGVDGAKTGEQTVIVSHYAPTGGWGLAIDAVHRVGDELWAFATLSPPPPDAAVTQAFTWVRDAVNVPGNGQTLPVKEIIRRLDEPSCQLHELTEAGTSTVLFDRDSEAPTAWNQCDADHTPTSLIAEPQDAVPPPVGFHLLRDSEHDQSIELLWDDLDARNSHDTRRGMLRRYQVEVNSLSARPVSDVPILRSSPDIVNAPLILPYPDPNRHHSSSVQMAGDRFRVAGPDGELQEFGGQRSLALSTGVYSFRVRVQYLPHLDSGSTGQDANQSRNMLATEWSAWSETSRFSVLPQDQDVLTIPAIGTDTQQPTLRWGPVDSAAGYEVWVNDLRTGRMVLNHKDVQDTDWQPDVAIPWGHFRFWVRATGPDGKVGRWSSPRDFDLIPPPVEIHAINSTVDSTPLISWEPQSGAVRYQVSVQRAYWQAYSPDLLAEVDASVTEFQISQKLDPGYYTVSVTSVLPHGIASTPGQHWFEVTGALSPSVNPSRRAISWITPPDIEGTDVWIAYLGGSHGNATQAATPQWKYLVQDGLASSTVSLPDDAPAGAYRAWIRYRYRDDASGVSVTDWSPATNWNLNYGGPLTSSELNFAADTRTVSWTPEPGAESYDVLVALVDEGGRSWGHSQIDDLTEKSITLDDVISKYPPGAVSDRLRFWVRANFPVSNSPTRTDWSEPLVVFTTAVPVPMASNTETVDDVVTQRLSLQWPAPPVTIEQLVHEPREQPDPPYRPYVSSHGNGTVHLSASAAGPADALASRQLVMANGVQVDLEFVSRFEFRLRNLVTGEAVALDESGVLQLHDHCEDFCWVLDRPALYETSGLHVDLDSGVYEIEARVKHIPVLLPGHQSLPLPPGIASTEEAAINLSPTPWSEWSAATEWSVLSEGQSIIAYGPQHTTDATTSFTWGPVAGAYSYELWVQNQTTGERVIYQNVGNVTSFEPSTDLTAGQYLWWVRPITWHNDAGDWSLPQRREVFEQAVSVSAPDVTVDATPVIQWAAAAGVVSYTVELSRAADGEVVYRSEKVTGTSHRVSQVLRNDTYHVWVRGEFADGAHTAPGRETNIGQFDRPTIVVGGVPELRAARTERVVAWDAVHGATRYEVWAEFRSDSGPARRVFHDTQTFDRQVTFPRSLTGAPGEKLHVWVRAIRDEAGRSYLGRWSRQIVLPTVFADSNAIQVEFASLDEIYTCGRDSIPHNWLFV